MFRGILHGVKDRRVHWFTDPAFYAADEPQPVTVSADCEPHLPAGAALLSAITDDSAIMC